MTRTLTRSPLLRRFVSLWVTIAFVLSMTNVTLAVPVYAGEIDPSVTQEVAVPVEQSSVERPVEQEVVAPTSEPVAEPTVEAAEPVVSPDPVEPSVSPVAEQVKPSREAEPVTASVIVPAAAQLALAALVTPVEVAGNPPLTAGGLRIDEGDLPGTFTHTYLGTEIEITVTVTETDAGMVFGFVSDYPVTKVVAKGGNTGANVYTYDPAVLSDEGLHTPMNPSGKWADISHLDFYFAVPAPTADVEVLKYEDLDADGTRDETEPLLDGWTITLSRDGDVEMTAETVDGRVVFADVPVGDYTIDEVLTDGWVNTTPLPIAITVVADEDATYSIGNRHLDVTKTFALTFTDAPEGAELSAAYTLGSGETGQVDLVLGENGVYTGSVELPHGTVIDSVTWTATLGGVTYVLGAQTGLDEVLTADVVNEFTYSASLSGHKFGDVDADGVWDEGEAGLSGWTIGLYRALPALEISALPLPLAGYELVAQTVTGEGGTYGFSGLLPGTYYVAEENRTGWFMTVGPEGTFEVSDGTALTGLDFGNAEEGLPFSQFLFDKQVDRQTAEPGDIVRYTLTYTLTTDSDPWTDPIPVIDDYDETYMTPVDVAGGVVANGTITWIDNDDMQPGETRVISYTMRVAEDMPEGTTDLPNVALLDVQDGYEDDENVTVVVEPVLPFTEFEFDKSANLSIARPGDVVTYTLTYTLTDDSDPFTDTIRIVDDFDERYMTPVEIGDGIVTDGAIVWVDDDDMQPGETRTIVYTMRIDAQMPEGTTAIDNLALLDVQDGYEDDWTVRVTVEREPFLPFTGTDLALLLTAAAIAVASGTVLRRAGTRDAS